MVRARGRWDRWEASELGREQPTTTKSGGVEDYSHAAAEAAREGLRGGGGGGGAKVRRRARGFQFGGPNAWIQSDGPAKRNERALTPFK